MPRVARPSAEDLAAGLDGIPGARCGADRFGCEYVGQGLVDLVAVTAAHGMLLPDGQPSRDPDGHGRRDGRGTIGTHHPAPEWVAIAGPAAGDAMPT